MRILLFFMCTLLGTQILAQGNLLPEGLPAAFETERFIVKLGLNTDIHTALMPLRRQDIANIAQQVDSLGADAGAWQIKYLLDDSYAWITTRDVPNASALNDVTTEKVYLDSTKTFYTVRVKEKEKVLSAGGQPNAKPLFGLFYKYRAALYDLNEPFFRVSINPLLRTLYSRDRNDQEPNFMNQRGVQVAGQIDKKVYFDFNILESQVRFPGFVTQRIIRDKAVPGAGSFTPYKSVLFDIKNGYDFLLSQGLVGMQITKHIGVQAGHGRHFIGDGYRSLLLSDFGNNYFFLRLNTRIWKLHYQNIFAQLKASSVRSNGPGNLLPSKYMSAHYLSLKLRKNMQIGLYESIIYSRNSLEPEYLNPIILYRTVEEQFGSPDNTVLGLNARWDIFSTATLYGQLFLDEFNFRKIVANNGWWGNKYGLQAGIKYFDVLGVQGLYMQMEANVVRPYTYTHQDSLRSYTNYRQPLAHPMGANFTEALAIAKYQPNAKWTFEARLQVARTGLDADSLNFGSNVLLPYTTRVSDIGVNQNQGARVNIATGNLELSYALYHNIWVDAQVLYRKQTSAFNQFRYNNLYFGVGLRANMGKWRNDF